MSELSLITAASQTTDTERLLLARLNLRTGLKFRSTTPTTALALASRTATTGTANISANGARGLLLLFNNTTTDATLTVDVGVYFLIINPLTLAQTTPFGVTYTDFRGLMLHPLLTDITPGINGLAYYVHQKRGGIPDTFRVGVGHSNANPITYSLTYCLIE